MVDASAAEKIVATVKQLKERAERDSGECTVSAREFLVLLGEGAKLTSIVNGPQQGESQTTFKTQCRWEGPDDDLFFNVYADSEIEWQP